MSRFEEYLQMKEEEDKAITAEQIHNFIKKYKCVPAGMIKDLQVKLNVFNRENQKIGIGMVHIINTY